MKIVRIKDRGGISWGVVQQERIRVLRGDPFRRIVFSSRTVPLAGARWCVPSVPSKIVLVGLNYHDHAAELKMPVPRQPIIFLKPLTTLIAHQQAIVCPPGVGRIDYEAELALVIKKTARHVRPARALDYVLGYTCLNDVTARQIQKRDGQWTRAKSYDTFCPVGPWVETECDPGRCTVALYRNGRMRQSSSTAQLIFPVAELVAFISSVMTLVPGDIISTGTPPGVGRMRPRDIVEVAIDPIGRLSNPVIAG